MPGEQLKPVLSYPYVLWKSKLDNGASQLNVRIVRTDPKSFTFEHQQQDAMGQDCWIPLSDGNMILACCMSALNLVADKAHMKGWFSDGLED